MSGENKDIFIVVLLHVYLNHIFSTMLFPCETISVVRVFVGT